jgi:transcriptional regulator with XRE-family HTH domain
MTLNDYLDKHRLGTREFAERLGVSASAVDRYRHGLRMPRPAIANKIVALTDNAVSLADLYAAVEMHQSGNAPPESERAA